MDNYFNLDVALEYVGGHVQIFENLQKRFISEYKNYEKELKKDFIKGNKEEVYKRIHSLKGITLNLGASELYKASCIAEEKLKNNIDDPLTEYLFVFEQTYIAIKKYKK